MKSQQVFSSSGTLKTSASHMLQSKNSILTGLLTIEMLSFFL